MALEIKDATVGYDEQGVRSLLNDIKANVIEEAENKLESSESKLIEALDDIWAGRSADTFKSNMHEDILTVRQALEGAYRALETEIYNARSAMGNVDDNLVEEYKN